MHSDECPLARIRKNMRIPIASIYCQRHIVAVRGTHNPAGIESVTIQAVEVRLEARISVSQWSHNCYLGFFSAIFEANVACAALLSTFEVELQPCR